MVPSVAPAARGQSSQDVGTAPRGQARPVRPVGDPPDISPGWPTGGVAPSLGCTPVTTSLPVVLIAEELAPSVLEVLGSEVEIRHVDGADRGALLPALADAAAVMIRSATQI